MNFTKVMRAAHSGRKVRRASWPANKSSLTAESRGYIIAAESQASTAIRIEDIFANDWEIVKPEPKPMTFTEALDCLKEYGGAMRRPGKNGKLRLNGLSLFVRYEVDNDDVYLTIEDYNADDWIHAEEDEE